MYTPVLANTSTSSGCWRLSWLPCPRLKLVLFPHVYTSVGSVMRRKTINKGVSSLLPPVPWCKPQVHGAGWFLSHTNFNLAFYQYVCNYWHRFNHAVCLDLTLVDPHVWIQREHFESSYIETLKLCAAYGNGEMWRNSKSDSPECLNLCMGFGLYEYLSTHVTQNYSTFQIKKKLHRTNLNNIVIPLRDDLDQRSNTGLQTSTGTWRKNKNVFYFSFSLIWVCRFYF